MILPSTLSQVLSPLIQGWGVLFVILTIAFRYSQKIQNAGIVDIIWASGFALLALLCAESCHGFWLRKVLIISMMVLAGIRLAWHLEKRFIHEFPKEDARYHALREAWGPQKSVPGFFIVFQIQGILIVLNTLPVVLAAINPSPDLSFMEGVSAMIWLFGFLGEAVADHQLSQFKANPANKGKTCQTGLWCYSRHPNYFCEWLMWLAYALFALSSPWGWVGLYVPVLMLFLLIWVSGIAASEAHSLKTRSDYAQYQATTSPFFPWFKRSPQGEYR